MTSTVTERLNAAGDHVVKFFLDGVHQADADYFTPNMVDAIATANFQCRQWNEVRTRVRATRKGGAS